MRVLLDTCVIIDWITDDDMLDESVWDIIDDPENRICVSAETIRELIVSFNNKKLLTKYWKTAKQMVQTIENDYGIEILPVTRDVTATYAGLDLNKAKDI